MAHKYGEFFQHHHLFWTSSLQSPVFSRRSVLPRSRYGRPETLFNGSFFGLLTYSCPLGGRSCPDWCYDACRNHRRIVCHVRVWRKAEAGSSTCCVSRRANDFGISRLCWTRRASGISTWRWSAAARCQKVGAARGHGDLLHVDLGREGRHQSRGDHAGLGGRDLGVAVVGRSLRHALRWGVEPRTFGEVARSRH